MAPQLIERSPAAVVFYSENKYILLESGKDAHPRIPIEFPDMLLQVGSVIL